MNCNWNHVDLGWRLGDIGSMSDEAIEVARLLNTKVSFEFNGVKVNVSKDSFWKDVADSALDALRNGDSAVFGKGF